MLRMLFFAGIGVILGGLSLAYLGIDSALGWGLGVGLNLAVLTGTLFLLGNATSQNVRVAPEVLAIARQENRIGFARVERIVQTGTLVNDNPVCELTVTAQPPQGHPFRGQLRMLIPLIQIPRYQPGTTHELAFFGIDNRQVVFTDESSPIPRASIRSQQSSMSQDPVKLMLAKLNRKGQLIAPIVGRGKRGRPLRVIGYFLALVVGAGMITLPFGDRAAAAFQAAADGRLHADLRTPGQMQIVINQFEKQTGHRNAVDIYLDKERVRAALPLAIGASETDSWTYALGHADHRGPAAIQPESEREQFPLDEVLWDAIWPAVEQGSTLSGIGISDELTISVQRSIIDDVGSDDFIQAYGPVEIRFSLSNDYHAAHFRMDAKGENLVMSR